MSRSADYTIKGFLYQFNKTLLEILNSHDASIITVEGIVEDVDVTTPAGMTAIQCKYHEASEKFTLSGIYKPLLQMMHHFHLNSSANISYILFAHYPSVKDGQWPTIDMTSLETALKSRDKDLKKYVSKLKGKIDLTTFLSRFSMEFGPAFDVLVAQVGDALKKNGFPSTDIETLAYPNAINMVAGLSVKHNLKDRKISKPNFLSNLMDIRKTAISHWTLALRTRKQLLEARHKQLKVHLDKNSRLRYFVIAAKSLDDYGLEIVLFITDYLNKYHCKIAHISTPIICLCTSEKDFQDIQSRLYAKGVVSTDGYIGGRFEEAHFFRDPLFRKVAGGAIDREFSIRLLRWDDHGNVLNNRKCDDLFVIGELAFDSLNVIDVNLEQLEATTLKEVKYLIGVSNVYE